MNWKIKAILQKVLSLSGVGDRLNHIPATLKKNYHRNVTIYQTHECVRKFSLSNVELSTSKTALEIGTGYSLISSIVLVLIGFEKVFTVDISSDVRFSSFKKQVAYLSSPEIIELLKKHTVFSETELYEKIESLQQCDSLTTLFQKFNISYIAPYSFDDIYKQHQQFDYIASQVVLEHMSPKTLHGLFSFIKKTLTKDYISVHTINFIDHFANPGFFQDTAISEFNFLQYSDNSWKFWAGNAIAYTNRLSYLYYIDLCKKYELEVVEFLGENYRERVEFPVEKIHSDVLAYYKSDVDRKELTKYQRGTLVIKNSKV